MFEDYRKYLTKLRNNLIQCGVEFPISPLITYRDSFLLGMQLDDVIWYYSILAISGSEDAIKGYCLPLNMYYKEQMRQFFYQEFLDFVKDYRKLSIMNMQLNGIQIQPHLSDVLKEDEEIDLFENKDVVQEENHESLQQSIVENEEREVFIPVPEVHGTFLDDEPNLLEPIVVKESGYAEHGIMLDELNSQIKDNDDNYREHGVMLDDLPTISESDGVLYDENGFEIMEDGSEMQEDLEDTVLYDENGFEIVEDTGTILNEEEEGVQYDENGFEIVDEDENLLSDDTLYDENGFEIVDENDSLLPDTSEDEFDEIAQPTQSTPVSKPSVDAYNEKDVSDYIQDITNNLLTKGKRVIVQGIRKMKDD